MSENLGPEAPKSAAFFLTEITKFVQEIAPNITSSQMDQLKELKKGVITANCQAIRLVQENCQQKINVYEVIEKNSRSMVETQQKIIREFKVVMEQLREEVMMLRKEQEIAEMLDDLEKELAARVI
ncbi:hypothetical protein CAEBREN_02700 [Caenorhabditis brenneri]|uniref:Uncharacterized protein n=1 Tax=Caenorhabditis brenneri TaxID=135651 RepID=G0M974_CAEBE|nr:hypothetical protein CAEBREN_02700 [Caenorhabditis brenneri]